MAAQHRGKAKEYYWLEYTEFVRVQFADKQNSFESSFPINRIRSSPVCR